MVELSSVGTVLNTPAILSALETGQFTGAVKGLSNREYHSLSKYWSSTQLKYLLSKSPRHFKAKYIDRVESLQDSDTPSKILGSLIHCLALSPDDFSREFYVMPELLNLRTNAGREERDLLVMENRDKICVKQEMLTQAKDVVRALFGSETFLPIGECEREISLFWECPYSGLMFRAKLDAFVGDKLFELKSALSAEPDQFTKQCDNLNYDLSLAHYLEGMRHVLSVTGSPEFIAVETEPPYVAAKYSVSSRFLDVGHAKWLTAVNQLMNASLEKKWDGYDDTVILSPTPWSTKKYLKEEYDGV